ncbi:hypothetical protein BH20ACI3_BH20ACI3_42960 [soil metagenome]
MAYLPSLQLAAGDTEVIEVGPSIEAHGQSSVTAAGIEFDYAGAPGSIVTSAFSISRSGNQVFRVPLWDIAAQRSATGGYPWYIEGDSSTMVYIKNVTDEPRQYTLQLRYDGGVYALGLKTLEARQTVALDLRALRDQQIPDESGHMLPRNATGGQVNWSMRGPQNQVLIGRSEQVDLSNGISSNYACMNCCPDSFSGGWVDPGGVESFVGDDTLFTGLEQTRNCYGSSNAPYNIWPSWDSSNWDVLGFCGGAGVGTADGPGLANAQATWLAYEWGSFESGNPNECYERPINVLAEAFCQMLLAADRLQVVSDTGQVALASCPSIITRQIVYQILDTNGAALNRIIRVREQFQNQTTNTCGNGQPTPSSCGPIIVRDKLPIRFQ